MKKLLLIGLILAMTGAGAFAVDVTATLPTVSGSFDATDAQAALDATIIPLAVDALAKFDSMNDLATGFANANSYAADAATTRGLMGYKFLTVAVGTMVGFQMPNSGFDAVADSLSAIEQDGDTYFGAGFQALTVSVGLNASFLVDGLYLTGKIGKFSVETDDVSYDSFVFGLLANYQLIDPLSIGIIKWRGVQVGSGLVYYNTTADMIVNVDPVSSSVDVTGSGDYVDLFLDPTLNLQIISKGFKIPVDLITGIRLLWIANLSFGIGVDINFGGSSEIALSADGSTYFDEDELANNGMTQTPGSVTASGGTEGDGAEMFRLRATAGIGFGIGPIKIDVPFTYYFDGKGPGANFGITGAITL